MGLILIVTDQSIYELSVGTVPWPCRSLYCEQDEAYALYLFRRGRIIVYLVALLGRWRERARSLHCETFKTCNL